MSNSFLCFQCITLRLPLKSQVIQRERGQLEGGKKEFGGIEEETKNSWAGD